MYCRALIEYLSVHLKEPGSSEQLRNDALKQAVQANPYIIWLLAYSDIFEVILDENGEDLLEDIIQNNLNTAGSVEEAFTFFKSKITSTHINLSFSYFVDWLDDASIWLEIDGIVDWLHSQIEEHELTPPEVTVTLPEKAPTDEEIEENPESQLALFHAMYLDMFKTGCEEIEERLIGGQK